jgi:hypothetical protein
MRPTMRRQFGTPAAPILALLLLAACGANPPATKPPDPPAPPVHVTPETFEDAYLDALCEARVRCGQLLDGSQCTDLALYGRHDTSFNGTQSVIASIAARRATFDAAAGDACLSKVRAQYCSLQGAALELESLCPDLLTGTVAFGAACVDSAECVAGASCAASGGACAGTCTAFPVGHCRRHADCGAGMACELTRCVAVRSPGKAGESCGVPGACADGLVRLRETDQTTHLTKCSCVTPPKAGERCTFLEPCATAELICLSDGATATCVPLRKKGESCTRAAECGPAVAGLACDTEGGTCRETPPSGPCLVEGLTDVCAHATFCDSAAATATCTALRHEGETCAADRECERPWDLACLGDASHRSCRPPAATHVCAP